MTARTSDKPLRKAHLAVAARTGADRVRECCLQARAASTGRRRRRGSRPAFTAAGVAAGLPRGRREAADARGGLRLRPLAPTEGPARSPAATARGAAAPRAARRLRPAHRLLQRVAASPGARRGRRRQPAARRAGLRPRRPRHRPEPSPAPSPSRCARSDWSCPPPRCAGCCSPPWPRPALASPPRTESPSSSARHPPLARGPSRSPARSPQRVSSCSAPTATGSDHGVAEPSGSTARTA